MHQYFFWRHNLQAQRKVSCILRKGNYRNMLKFFFTLSLSYLLSWISMILLKKKLGNFPFISSRIYPAVITIICPSLQSFINLLNKYIWSAQCVLAIVLITEERIYGKQTKAKNIAKKQSSSFLPLRKCISWWGFQTINK